MRDLTPAMRSVEINSPGRAVSTLAATKLFIDCFLFISQTTEGTDYRAIVSAGRCHFSRRRRPFRRPASVVYTMRETRGFRNYYAVDAQRRRFRFTIGIVYDTHVSLSMYLSYIYLYSHTNSLRAKWHAPARVRMYRSSFKPRCKPRRLPVIS